MQPCRGHDVGAPGAPGGPVRPAPRGRPRSDLERRRPGGPCGCGQPRRPRSRAHSTRRPDRDLATHLSLPAGDSGEPLFGIPAAVVVRTRGDRARGGVHRRAAHRDDCRRAVRAARRVVRRREPDGVRGLLVYANPPLAGLACPGRGAGSRRGDGRTRSAPAVPLRPPCRDQLWRLRGRGDRVRA